jgi:hypothetical protein
MAFAPTQASSQKITQATPVLEVAAKKLRIAQ